MTPFQFQYIVQATDGVRDISLPEMDSTTPDEDRGADQDRWTATRERSIAVEKPLDLPEADPFAWGERKPGQSESHRRQEIVQIARRRRVVQRGSEDARALDAGEMELEDIAQAEIESRKQAAKNPPQRPTAQPVPVEPPQVSHSRATRRPNSTAGSQDRARRERREAKMQRMAEIEAGDEFPHARAEFPRFAGNEAIPPREGRDNDDVPIETFGRATVGFSKAVQRALAQMSERLVEATRRIEALEADREMESNA